MPLREVSAQVHEVFADNAMTTVGDECDFKHFLPRLLELRLLDDWLLELKLDAARWRHWPEAERNAVLNWFAERVVGDLEAGLPIELDRLERVASLVQPRLELERSPNAPLWYAQLVCALGRDPERLRPRLSILFDWVWAAPQIAALDRAFFAATDQREAATFSNAVLVAEWF